SSGILVLAADGRTCRDIESFQHHCADIQGRTLFLRVPIVSCAEPTGSTASSLEFERAERTCSRDEESCLLSGDQPGKAPSSLPLSPELHQSVGRCFQQWRGVRQSDMLQEAPRSASRG